MNFKTNFTLLLKARYPIIYIVTKEEERAESAILENNIGRPCYSWNFIAGYQGKTDGSGFAKKNPLMALDLPSKLDTQASAIFILKDYDLFFKDSSIIRTLKNLNSSIKTQSKNIIIISPDVNIPDPLKEIITIINFPLPTQEEISEEVKRLTYVLQETISDKTISNITNACQGLTLEKIRRVLSRAIAEEGNLTKDSLLLILEEKKQIIQQTQLLEFCLPDQEISDLGGLNNLKKWLRLRSTSFSSLAREYGLPFPKGLLLVGVQGTGKSIAAKAIASEWSLPLLRLDFGKLFASLVGQSEFRIRKVIEIAEALAPCILWIDEIDKAFSSAQNSGDNGTTNRVLATFITWLSEKKSSVFIIATANKIECIPPEVIRKGRFDEIFFLPLPNYNERAAIFNVHLRKVRPKNSKYYELPLLSKISSNFSGAEIEQSVIDAMRLGFHKEKEFSVSEILVATRNIVPLARIKNKEIDQLQKWASSGNINIASENDIVKTKE